MIPEIKWFQTKEIVNMKLTMSNIKTIDNNNLKVNLEKGYLNFSYKEYEFKEELSHELEELKISNNGRILTLQLIKKEKDYWDSIFKENKFNKLYVKIDWDNWCDFDSEEDDNTGTENNNLEMNGMNGMNLEQLSQMMSQYQNSDNTSDSDIINNEHISSNNENKDLDVDVDIDEENNNKVDDTDNKEDNNKNENN